MNALPFQNWKGGRLGVEASPGIKWYPCVRRKQLPETYRNRFDLDWFVSYLTIKSYCCCRSSSCWGWGGDFPVISSLVLQAPWQQSRCQARFLYSHHVLPGRREQPKATSKILLHSGRSLESSLSTKLTPSSYFGTEHKEETTALGPAVLRNSSPARESWRQDFSTVLSVE